DCAEPERQQTLEESVGAERELERSTADVDDRSTPHSEIEVRERAAKAQRRLVFSIDDFYSQSGFLSREIEKTLAVRCAADRARRDHLRAFCAELFRKRSHAAECRERVLNRDFTEAAGLLDTCAESRRGFHFIDDADASVGRDIGDYLTNRVGPDVDRGDASWIIRALRRDSARAQRQRGSASCIGQR